MKKKKMKEQREKSSAYMMTVTEKVEGLLKEAVDKDLAIIEDILKGLKSIQLVVELKTHFYDSDALLRFFDELKSFLDTYDHFIPRIEGVHKYDGEDDECAGECHIYFSISGGGDDVYNWGHMFRECAKNTLNFIKKFGGKVVMFDSGGSWEF